MTEIPNPIYTKPLCNRVIITPAVDMSKVLHGSLELHAPIGADGQAYDQFKSAPVVCTVVAAPRKLLFAKHRVPYESVMEIETTPQMKMWMHQRRIASHYTETTMIDVAAPGTMMWKTKPEVREGDVVWVNANFMFNAKEHGNYMVYEGKEYFIVTYDNLYMRRKGDEVKMLNGWVLAELIEDNPDWIKRAERAGLFIPDIIKKEEFNDRLAVIKYIGEPTEYLFEDRYDDPIIKEGDVVLLKTKVNRRLEPGQKFFAKDGELRVIRRSSVLAVMEL